MKDCDFYKNILLEEYKPYPNVEIDVKYVDKYIDLCKKNENTKAERRKTQRHHILPAGKTAFPTLAKEKWNIINVPYFDHVMLHWYLYKAFKSYHSAMSVWRLIGFTKHPLVDKLENEDEIKELAKINYEIRNEFFNSRKNRPYTQRKRIWVTDYTTEKYILPEEEQEYLNKGFVRGRSKLTNAKISKANSGRVMPEEQKEKIRQHHLSVSYKHHMKSPEKRAWASEQARKNFTRKTPPNKGKLIFIKDGVQTFVNPEEKALYEAAGWKHTSLRKGKTNKDFQEQTNISKHQKTYMIKDGKEICVLNRERAKYMLDGWKVGRLNEQADTI